MPNVHHPNKVRETCLEAYQDGETVDTEFLEDLAEAVCGRCLDGYDVSPHPDSNEALWLSLENRPRRRRRRA